MVSVYEDNHTEALHFVDKAEPRFEDVLGHHRNSIRNGVEADGHRLQVCGEAREGKGLVVGGLGTLVHHHAETIFKGVHLGAGELELFQWEVKVTGCDAPDSDISPRHGGGERPCARNDAVTDDLMRGRVELLHAVDGDLGGTLTFNIGTHGTQHAAEVDNLGFAGCVIQGGLPLSHD